jgi:HK97 family phage prohead protease
MSDTHPVDNLIRARRDDGAIEVRASESASGTTLFGHFAVFDQWTQIDSMYEGRFMERVGDGAFTRTFGERRDKIRVLYDHGKDPFIGNKPLGAPDVLRVDRGVGAYYESELFDASYVRDLLPALRAGQLGASFRFRVLDEEWVDPKRSTEWNPDRLPERTLLDVELYELGPTTFGAYEGATAGLRSATDDFLNRLLSDPIFVARFTERVGERISTQVLSSLPADGRSQEPAPTVPADGGPTEAPPKTTGIDLSLALAQRQRLSLPSQGDPR